MHPAAHCPHRPSTGQCRHTSHKGDSQRGNERKPERSPGRRAAAQPSPAGLLAPGSSPNPRLPISIPRQWRQRAANRVTVAPPQRIFTAFPKTRPLFRAHRASWPRLLPITLTPPAPSVNRANCGGRFAGFVTAKGHSGNIQIRGKSRYGNPREKRAKVTISGFAGILYLTNKHRTERASARRSYQITGKRRNQKTPGKPQRKTPKPCRVSDGRHGTETRHHKENPQESIGYFTLPEGRSGIMAGENWERDLPAATRITGDLNPVEIQAVAQYRISDLNKYLFHATTPEWSLNTPTRKTRKSGATDPTTPACPTDAPSG